MAAVICPAVLASDPHEYRDQMEQVERFAGRVHIDVSDGRFAPALTLRLDQLWWPASLTADLHVMYERPFDHLEIIKTLHPQLVIVHAESEGDFLGFAAELHRHGMETGVALLPETPVSLIEDALDAIDHVLIFSGRIGHFGGTADLQLLDKVRYLRGRKPALEIGWDGGVNDLNIRELIHGGVDVLNAGGFIQESPHPEQAYATLKKAIAG